MKKNKNFKIPINVYPFVLMFSLEQTDKALKKALKKNKVIVEDIGMKEDEYEAYYCYISDGLALIRMKKYPDDIYQLAILQHEILHATIDILRQVGIRLNEKSEEAYTYLQEYITHECLKQIKWKG